MALQEALRADSNQPPGGTQTCMFAPSTDQAHRVTLRTVNVPSQISLDATFTRFASIFSDGFLVIASILNSVVGAYSVVTVVNVLAFISVLAVLAG